MVLGSRVPPSNPAFDDHDSTIGDVELLYDDDCGLCTRSVRWLCGRTSGVDFSPMEDGSEESAVVLLLSDGTKIEGAQAVATVLKTCGRPWDLVGAVMQLPAMRVLASAVYKVVARNRTMISRSMGWGACAIPREETSE